MEVWKLDDSKHVCEQIHYRYPKIKKPEEELQRIIMIMKSNIPDEWRLTRFSSDFIVRDMKTDVTLVGYQTRKDKISNIIIKHVTTALRKGGFSVSKMSQFAGSPVAQDIAKRPNIFIDFSSRVFARQYEKVHYSYKNISFTIEGKSKKYTRYIKSPIEYFRLNPLTKDGLMKDEQLWVRWDAINGHVKLVENSPEEYHGEDYWFLQFEDRKNKGKR
jgi:hypothetical protein